MNTYRHSVYLEGNKCNGCTTCLHRCPTEAIRIRKDRAVIDFERCIDCGECIRVCPNHAKKSAGGKLEEMSRYKWRIAVPSPALYGQFENLEDIDCVLDGLLRIGFDDVFEEASAAELASAYTRIYLRNEEVKKPAISSSCPAVLRLIGLRFPSLSENIIHLLPPSEIAAKLARARARKEHPDLRDEDIGVFHISPCPAKVSYVNNGFADYKSSIDVVVPISDIYFRLISEMRRDDTLDITTTSGILGIGWATSGGESTALFNENYLAADGIDNVIRVLDQIENGNMPQLEFIELNACPAGCVGGVCTVENPFIAKARLQGLRRYLPVSQNFLSEADEALLYEYMFDELPRYRPISQLGETMIESMRMMAKSQEIRKELPGIDCGACGAPSCRAFAEDIVKGKTDIEKCIVLRCRKEKTEAVTANDGE